MRDRDNADIITQLEKQHRIGKLGEQRPAYGQIGRKIAQTGE
jgi:hypothetical protein